MTKELLNQFQKGLKEMYQKGFDDAINSIEGAAKVSPNIKILSAINIVKKIQKRKNDK